MSVAGRAVALSVDDPPGRAVFVLYYTSIHYTSIYYTSIYYTSMHYTWLKGLHVFSLFQHPVLNFSLRYN